MIVYDRFHDVNSFRQEAEMFIKPYSVDQIWFVHLIAQAHGGNSYMN